MEIVISPNYDVWDDVEENLYFGVYTLGTNSWKVIRDMPCNFRYLEDSRGLHINGGLHWIGSVSSTKSNDGIISFDIEDEKCGEVPKPDCLDVTTNATTLQVLGGCLCIFNFDSENSIDVWMMKDYGVRDSWTKLFTIQFRRREYYQVTLQAFWLFKHGEVLMDFDDDFVLYDPKCETFENIGPRAFNNGWFDTVIYMESLVSLKSNRLVMQVNI